jgi:hypothetical protein
MGLSLPLSLCVASLGAFYLLYLVQRRQNPIHRDWDLKEGVTAYNFDSTGYWSLCLSLSLILSFSFCCKALSKLQHSLFKELAGALMAQNEVVLYDSCCWSQGRTPV